MATSSFTPQRFVFLMSCFFLILLSRFGGVVVLAASPQSALPSTTIIINHTSTTFPFVYNTPLDDVGHSILFKGYIPPGQSVTIRDLECGGAIIDLTLFPGASLTIERITATIEGLVIRHEGSLPSSVCTEDNGALALAAQASVSPTALAAARKDPAVTIAIRECLLTGSWGLPGGSTAGLLRLPALSVCNLEAAVGSPAAILAATKSNLKLLLQDNVVTARPNSASKTIAAVSFYDELNTLAASEWPRLPRIGSITLRDNVIKVLYSGPASGIISNQHILYIGVSFSLPGSFYLLDDTLDLDLWPRPEDSVLTGGPNFVPEIVFDSNTIIVDVNWKAWGVYLGRMGAGNFIRPIRDRTCRILLDDNTINITGMYSVVGAILEGATRFLPQFTIQDTRVYLNALPLPAFRSPLPKGEAYGITGILFSTSSNLWPSDSKAAEMTLNESQIPEIVFTGGSMLARVLSNDPSLSLQLILVHAEHIKSLWVGGGIDFELVLTANITSKGDGKMFFVKLDELGPDCPDKRPPSCAPLPTAERVTFDGVTGRVWMNKSLHGTGAMASITRRKITRSLIVKNCDYRGIAPDDSYWFNFDRSSVFGDGILVEYSRIFLEGADQPVFGIASGDASIYYDIVSATFRHLDVTCRGPALLPGAVQYTGSNDGLALRYYRIPTLLHAHDIRWRTNRNRAAMFIQTANATNTLIERIHFVADVQTNTQFINVVNRVHGLDFGFVKSVIVRNCYMSLRCAGTMGFIAASSATEEQASADGEGADSGIGIGTVVKEDNVQPVKMDLLFELSSNVFIAEAYEDQALWDSIVDNPRLSAHIKPQTINGAFSVSAIAFRGFKLINETYVTKSFFIGGATSAEFIEVSGIKEVSCSTFNGKPLGPRLIRELMATPVSTNPFLVAALARAFNSIIGTVNVTTMNGTCSFPPTPTKTPLATLTMRDTETRTRQLTPPRTETATSSATEPYISDEDLSLPAGIDVASSSTSVAAIAFSSLAGPSVPLDTGRALSLLGLVSRCKQYREALFALGPKASEEKKHELRERYAFLYMARRLSFPESLIPPFRFGSVYGSYLRGAVVSGFILIVLLPLLGVAWGLVTARTEALKRWKKKELILERNHNSNNNSGYRNNNNSINNNADSLSSNSGSSGENNSSNNSNESSNQESSSSSFRIKKPPLSQLITFEEVIAHSRLPYFVTTAVALQLSTWLGHATALMIAPSLHGVTGADRFFLGIIPIFACWFVPSVIFCLYLQHKHLSRAFEKGREKSALHRFCWWWQEPMPRSDAMQIEPLYLWFPAAKEMERSIKVASISKMRLVSCVESLFTKTSIGRTVFSGDFVWSMGSCKNSEAMGAPGSFLRQCGSILNKFHGPLSMEARREILRRERGSGGGDNSNNINNNELFTLSAAAEAAEVNYNAGGTKIGTDSQPYRSILSPFSVYINSAWAAAAALAQTVASLNPGRCDDVMVVMAVTSAVILVTAVLLRPFISPMRNGVAILAELISFIACVVSVAAMKTVDHERGIAMTVAAEVMLIVSVVVTTVGAATFGVGKLMERGKLVQLVTRAQRNKLRLEDAEEERRYEEMTSMDARSSLATAAASQRRHRSGSLLSRSHRTSSGSERTAPNLELFSPLLVADPTIATTAAASGSRSNRHSRGGTVDHQRRSSPQQQEITQPHQRLRSLNTSPFALSAHAAGASDNRGVSHSPPSPVNNNNHSIQDLLRRNGNNSFINPSFMTRNNNSPLAANLSFSSERPWAVSTPKQKQQQQQNSPFSSVNHSFETPLENVNKPSRLSAKQQLKRFADL